jgi:type I restriction enzyme S subunit
MELLKCEPFPKPPRDEQVAIVHFINHAKMRIDKAIRAKRKLIALLNEQKQVVIHRAMTRGLNSNAKLKPSGVQWIGHIPVNWTVKRLKWVTRLQRGYDLPQDKRIPGPYPVVSSGGIIGTHCEAKSSGPGIVMGRYGSTNAIFFVEHDFWPHNTSLFVTDFQGNHKRWSYYLLGTISKSDHSSKSAVPGVDRKDLFDIYVPVPSFQEQAILADKIDAEVAGFEKSIKNAEHEITLLREYRTRLISDVVTGKLDVREAAKHLPVKTAELESSMDVDGNETGDEEEFEPALIEGDL